MLMVKLDSKGLKKIKWPASDVEIVKTAITLLAAETELKDGKCFPKLNLLRKMILFAKEETDFDALIENENEISENNALAKAKDFTRVIVNGLAYFHDHELNKLTEWGLTVEKDKIYPPLGRDMILEMLQKYVQKELALMPNLRLQSPPIAQVQAVIKILVLSREKREKSKLKKDKKQKPEVIERLLDVLQLAAMYHIVLDFEGVIDERISDLGFEVVDVPQKQPRVKKSEKKSEEIINDQPRHTRGTQEMSNDQVQETEPKQEEKPIEDKVEVENESIIDEQISEQMVEKEVANN